MDERVKLTPHEVVDKQCDDIYHVHPEHQWGERGMYYHCAGIKKEDS